MCLLLDKKATIFQKTYTRSRWSDIVAKTVLYSLIDCYFWSSGAENFTDTVLARETDQERYEVVLPIDNKLVKKGMYIELFEPSQWMSSIGEFVIDHVDIGEFSCGIADNIYLRISNR